MTKAVRNRILKDANGHISDHLRNHIHLTNCIHLKNHMHKQSPMLTDRSLMRDLIVLQRSRSLRDPSASPPSWHSPSVVDLLPKKGDKDSAFVEGRRSVGIERRRESRRLSNASPPFSLAPSKVVPGELSGGYDGLGAAIMSSGPGNRRRNRREESSRKSNGEDPLLDRDVNGLMNDVVSRNSESKSRKSKQKEKRSQDSHIKTLSEQLNEVSLDSDLASSNVYRRHGGPSQQEIVGKEPEPEMSNRGYTGPKRVKRRKFQGARRSRATPSSRDIGAPNEMSVASNSLAQGSAIPRHHFEVEEEEEELGNHNVTRIPKNGCGIPFNWSRIHHRGKTFLDMAGRSLSCGMSDTKLRRGGTTERDGRNIPVASDFSDSSTKSDVEALPLLVDASGSLESAGWVHDYSGELGLYADHLLKNDVDSDLASEARSGGQRNLGRYQNGRHQSLTQKYMPKTFRDLVGQNLVAQALSNAVVRRKIGLLYVFYGPHGTGKTSCARIFAKALNCRSLEHPKPCGHCSSCVAHDTGKSRNVREIGPVNNFDFESIVDLLDNMIVSQLPSQFRVFIFDDCDTLTPDCWSAITKVIDRAPRRVVFVLVSSSLDVLPHIIISRCQKFFFPKLKDADIIYSLQWIATKEFIDIDKDALKLIASRSDGSLRDAEMTLEQLSLLGLKISVPLVQELVGLVPDEKLVDLLDLALSADTMNTVKNLRVIMETGVEPLALMSQLATVITDILAGSYDYTKERNGRKFFQRQPLSKEHMEKLRQALKTLSEAEKQLRMSSDKLTWLTAALLRLAPDQQYMLPSSSAETSFNHSPLTLDNPNGSGISRKSGSARAALANNDRVLSTQMMSDNLPGTSNEDKKQNGGAGTAQQRQIAGKSGKGYEEIWLEVLGNIQFNSIREFLYQEGKLISVSFGSAPTVQLLFSSHFSKSKAEKFVAHILQAFECVIGTPATIEIRCEPNTSTPLVLPPSKNTWLRSEIVEIPASPRETKGNEDKSSESNKIGVMMRASLGESAISHKGASLERRKVGEVSRSKSIVRSKVSLAHVIQRAEGCAQQSAWSKRKAVSIAEKLEQENLRLEPRSRSLLCWKACRITRRKLSRLKIRTRRPQSLLKLVSCGKCLSSRSPM